MSAIQEPFILSCIGTTGSGKTHNTANFLQKLHTGQIPMVTRNDTRYAPARVPSRFRQVYYIGQRGQDSEDEKHNENVRRIIASGEQPGVVKTLRELQADRFRQDVTRFGCPIAPVNSANLIPDYVASTIIGPWNDVQSKQQSPRICIVFDDLSSILGDMDKATQQKMKDIFLVDSHHSGFSLIFLYQTYPRNSIGNTLFSNSHYILFPIPPLDRGGSKTSAGLTVSNFRSIMQLCTGFSKEILAEFEQMISRSPRPAYIIFNKCYLVDDSTLEGTTTKKRLDDVN